MSTVANHSAIHSHHPALHPLKPVLQEWINLTQRYLSHFDHQFAAYHCNERGSLGVLAAAAWRAGSQWIALEEFVAEPEAARRCDLYLADHRGFSAVIEAKQCWQQVQDPASSFAEIASQLAASVQEIENLPKDQAAYRLGACFVAPSFGDAPDYEEQLSDWLGELHARQLADALAWHFPASARPLLAQDGRHYPGACLLLKLH